MQILEVERVKVEEEAVEKAAEMEAEKAAEMEAEKAAEMEAEKAAEMEAEKAAQMEAEKAAEMEAEKAAEMEAKKAAENVESRKQQAAVGTAGSKLGKMAPGPSSTDDSVDRAYPEAKPEGGSKGPPLVTAVQNALGGALSNVLSDRGRRKLPKVQPDPEAAVVSEENEAQKQVDTVADDAKGVAVVGAEAGAVSTAAAQGDEARKREVEAAKKAAEEKALKTQRRQVEAVEQAEDEKATEGAHLVQALAAEAKANAKAATVATPVSAESPLEAPSVATQPQAGPTLADIIANARQRNAATFTDLPPRPGTHLRVLVDKRQTVFANDDNEHHMRLKIGMNDWEEQVTADLTRVAEVPGETAVYAAEVTLPEDLFQFDFVIEDTRTGKVCAATSQCGAPGCVVLHLMPSTPDKPAVVGVCSGVRCQRIRSAMRTHSCETDPCHSASMQRAPALAICLD
jgi:coenzyme F420-reducing hydrogenase delta subunit